MIDLDRTKQVRNRAEADEPTTGSGQSTGEPDAGQDPA
jgi:hypothetical protein